MNYAKIHSSKKDYNNKIIANKSLSITNRLKKANNPRQTKNWIANHLNFSTNKEILSWIIIWIMEILPVIDLWRITVRNYYKLLNFINKVQVH